MTNKINQLHNAYSLTELLEFIDTPEEIDPERFSHTPPYTAGVFLERLEVEERRAILRKLTEKKASEVLSEMDLDDSAETLGLMRENRAIKILESLDSDDAADLVGQLKKIDRDRLLSKLTPKTADTVRELLTYAPESAGGVMNPDVAIVPSTITVDQAIQHIRTLRDTIETIHYIYVVDSQKRLEGVVSMRDLILASPHQLIGEIMKKELKGVCHPEEDREKIALEMAHLNLAALPIVDKERHLLGVITNDDVIDILQAEATEDMQRLVGAGPDESIHDKLSYSINRRSPWLVVNLLTAFLAAGVVYFFQTEIHQLTLLAVFMPIVASLGGNTGSQTLAVAIRSIALGQVHPGDNQQVCLQEAAKGLCNGLIIGTLSAIIAWMLTGKGMISLVVFCAMILTMSVAGIAGAFIPLILKKFDLDPAQSSSIFLTAVTDIAGFFIFLSLGAWLLI